MIECDPLRGLTVSLPETGKPLAVQMWPPQRMMDALKAMGIALP